MGWYMARVREFLKEMERVALDAPTVEERMKAMDTVISLLKLSQIRARKGVSVEETQRAFEESGQQVRIDESRLGALIARAKELEAGHPPQPPAPVEGGR